MVITIKDYKEIRQRFLSSESQRNIAKVMGISRNTVKKYCEGASVPWIRKTPIREATVLSDRVMAFIQSCIDEDQHSPTKKQRHTARRIFTRLVDELGYTGSESTIRNKVRQLKQSPSKVFIPLQFDPAEAMQMDWGEVTIYLNGEKLTIYIFCARLCYSAYPVIRAYRHQNEESFLDAFVHVFNHLDGVPKRVIFDNAKVAVKRGFGKHAIKQEKYSALSAHYAFDAQFCNVASSHEKGLFEGLVGWARRNIFVPIPQVKSLAELNELLEKRCQAYRAHRIRGRKNTVSSMLDEEQAYLMALPQYPFDVSKSINARVNAYSVVRFKQNTYSVPVQYTGAYVGIKAYPESIEIYHNGALIATHNRCLDTEQHSYQLDHYLPILKERGRAIFNAIPVRDTIPQEVLDELQRKGTSH